MTLSQQTLDELLELAVDALGPRLADEVMARLDARQRGDEEITAVEVAVLLGVNVETVRRRARAGHIPARGEGGRLRFRRADVEEYQRVCALPVAARPLGIVRRSGVRPSAGFRDRLRSVS